MNNNIIAIIVAAGSGKRFGSDLPKQFLKLKDKTILQISLEKFFFTQKISNIIVVAHQNFIEYTQNIISQINPTKEIRVISGGKERQDSVWNGIQEALKLSPNILLIHDAVRPFVSIKLIDDIINATFQHKAAVPAIPLKDTIKIKDQDYIIKTMDRNNLVAVQTPQGFETTLIVSAYEKAFKENYYSTDDSNLVEQLGYRIKFVPGESTNIKITTQEDFLLAEFFWLKQSVA